MKFLGPGGKAAVPVLLQAMAEPTQAQILVFAREKGSEKHEALSFTISYIK